MDKDEEIVEGVTPEAEVPATEEAVETPAEETSTGEEIAA